MSPAAEQAGELSPSEKLFAERRMDVELFINRYITSCNATEAARLIDLIPPEKKNSICMSLFNAPHGEDLEGAIIDLQSDILFLIRQIQLAEMPWPYSSSDAQLASMKRSQQRKDDLL